MINVRSKQKWRRERYFFPIHCTLNTLKMNMIIFEQLSGNGIRDVHNQQFIEFAIQNLEKSVNSSMQ